LGVAAALLVLASVAGQVSKYVFGHDQVYGLVPLFYVDDEQNIPALFSVLLLSGAAFLLTMLTVLKRQQRDRDTLRWAILAAGFLVMAVDEACSLHEKLIPPMKRLLGKSSLGIFYFAWVIPGFVVVAMVGLVYLGFLFRLPRKARVTFVLAATLFLGGVLGLELIGGRYAELHGSQNLTYSMLSTIEESLEMAGVIVFIYALLDYMAATYDDIRVGFDR
jgi:hypothetical protein